MAKAVALYLRQHPAGGYDLPPPADSGCPKFGYARLRDLWVIPPPPLPPPKHPLQCFLNQIAADPRRVMSPPENGERAQRGGWAGSDAMPPGLGTKHACKYSSHHACPTQRNESRVSDTHHTSMQIISLCCSPRCTSGVDWSVFCFFDSDLILTSLFLSWCFA